MFFQSPTVVHALLSFCLACASSRLRLQEDTKDALLTLGSPLLSSQERAAEIELLPLRSVATLLLSFHLGVWHVDTDSSLRNVALLPSPRQPQLTMNAAPSGNGGRAVGLAGPAKGTQKAIDLSSVKGTRDFPPEEMRLQRWLFENFRAISNLFGYEEWDAPVLESEELYTRKAGEEITEQLYNFEDKGGRRLALRPELTPSLARLVLQKGKALTLPARWFAIGQCWRYERMTRGRRREHYQWNMDIFGVPSVDAEAELLAAIVAFFSRLGLSEKDVGIKVSSRKVLQAVLDRYGVSEEQFAPVAVIVDKMDKLPREKVEEELAALGVAPDAVDGIISALAIKDLKDLENLVGEKSEAVSDLRRLFLLAEGYGYKDWITFDASVVRGLAYYTGIVFEGFDRAGKLRAICGGGRYDRLLGTFGGENIPAAGFGFGDAVIVELLKERGLLPNLSQGVSDLVVALDDELSPAAAKVATALRSKGREVELVLESKKMKWIFKRCERIGASRLVILAEDEYKRGMVKVKDLESGEQKEVRIEDL